MADDRRIPGPDDRPERMPLAEALRALDAELGKPGPDYPVPVSTFPITRAARAALKLAGGLRKGRRLAPANRRTGTGQAFGPWPDEDPATRHTSRDSAGKERGSA